MYVMWDRVEQYLADLSFHTSVENGKPHHSKLIAQWQNSAMPS